MSHTYTQNVLHIVFSTKERQRTIPEAKQSRLWAYVSDICRHEGMFDHEIGGMEDRISSDENGIASF
ncbi:MAG: transposase [Acidobacteriia bacterium]|nr:transposase [Terriglobia bacterium]